VLNVTKSQILAASTGGLLAIVLVVSNIPAQSPARPGAGQPLGGQPIYLLDINHVFKNHSRLKAMKAELQADVQRAEERVKKEKDAIKKLMERLAQFRPGTQEYKDLEQEIATRQADLNVLITLQRKDFLQQEARIYHNVYREIYEEVDYFANQNRAAMVLKFDREAMDVERPETVVRGINKEVIWNNRGLDITDYIVDKLNGRLNTHSTERPSVPINSGGGQYRR
jgi:Skp family chaperone for outer membrane proteins